MDDLIYDIRFEKQKAKQDIAEIEREWDAMLARVQSKANRVGMGGSGGGGGGHTGAVSSNGQPVHGPMGGTGGLFNSAAGAAAGASISNLSVQNSGIYKTYHTNNYHGQLGSPSQGTADFLIQTAQQTNMFMAAGHQLEAPGVIQLDKLRSQRTYGSGAGGAKYTAPAVYGVGSVVRNTTLAGSSSPDTTTQGIPLGGLTHLQAGKSIDVRITNWDEMPGAGGAGGNGGGGGGGGGGSGGGNDDAGNGGGGGGGGGSGGKGNRGGGGRMGRILQGFGMSPKMAGKIAGYGRAAAGPLLALYAADKIMSSIDDNYGRAENSQFDAGSDPLLKDVAHQRDDAIFSENGLATKIPIFGANVRQQYRYKRMDAERKVFTRDANEDLAGSSISAQGDYGRMRAAGMIGSSFAGSFLSNRSNANEEMSSTNLQEQIALRRSHSPEETVAIQQKYELARGMAATRSVKSDALTTRQLDLSNFGMQVGIDEKNDIMNFHPTRGFANATSKTAIRASQEAYKDIDELYNGADDANKNSPMFLDKIRKLKDNANLGLKGSLADLGVRKMEVVDNILGGKGVEMGSMQSVDAMKSPSQENAQEAYNALTKSMGELTEQLRLLNNGQGR